MATVKLPELGEGLSEGEVVAWRVNEGDSIKADQTMVEIMTDKATVEVPSPKSGIVKKLFYKAGQLAKVGAPLIELEESGGASTAAPKEKPQSKVAPAKAETAPASEEAEAKEPAEESTTETSVKTPAFGAPAAAAQMRATDGLSKVLASPAVRKKAREMNLSLEEVQGSGDRGRVLKDDLVKAPAKTAPAAAAVSKSSTSSSLPTKSATAFEERVPFIGIRRKIAEHLTESAHKLVHFTHFDEVDFTEVIKLREELNAYSEKQNLGIKLSYLPFFIKGAIAAMRRFPILNSSLDEERGEVVIKHYFHFGISVQTDNGLMVGVVRDCDKKDIFQIAKEIKEVADRARTGKASMQDLTGSTITITNPGNIGGLYATPIINFPESVILGMFQIKKRPVVRELNGEDIIVAKPMMYTNITCDHRVVDGAIAAGYLRLFAEYMENPARMAFA